MYKKTILAVALLFAIGLTIALTFTSKSNSYTKKGPIKRVLILGNSIVRHGPRPEIGWYQNYGMAASSIDSDFVHILIRNIKAKDSSCQVFYENIADFESGYWNWDYTKADTFASFRPDIIIMRIAENVNDELAEKYNFIDYYDKLIHHIDTGENAMVFICNGWWDNQHVNRLLQDYAEENNCHFIDQAGLNTIATKAIGLYPDKDIQQHPNNLGMQKIAESIWLKIGKYF
jgi:hypothetical protein